MLALVEISKLRAHEMTDPDNLLRVKALVEEAGAFIEPILVDKDNFVVLDGHHRLQICKMLGLRRIPCELIDYSSEHVKVESRRPEIAVSKDEVIRIGRSDTLFPSKTTLHYLGWSGHGILIPLDALK